MTAPREALRIFIDQRRFDAFEWGRRDCCLTVADAVQAMTGQDFARDLRGYKTEKGAIKRLRKAGFARVRDVLAARLRPANRVACGVVLLINNPPLDCLLIAQNAREAWGQDAHGMTRTPIPINAEIWTI